MLTSSAASFTRKQYAFIGKIFIQKEPQIAAKLIDLYLPKTEPVEKDYSKIPAYYIDFCRVQGLLPQDYIGALHKTSKVNVRRVFIAVMLHLYEPVLFQQPVDDLILNREGLSKNLSNLFQVRKHSISATIREVVMWEKQYDDFSSSVNEIIEKLLNNNTAG